MAYVPSGRKFVTIKSGARIDRAMKARDVNGAELADIAGVTRATISNIRRGKNRRVAEPTARRIELCLGAIRGELFDDETDDDEAEAV